MAYWSRIEADPPPAVSDAYGNGTVCLGCLFWATGLVLSAWLAWG